MKKIACTLFVIVFYIISHAQVQLIHSFENISCSPPQNVNIPFLGQFYIGLAKVHKFSI